MFDDLLDVGHGVPPKEHLGAPHHLRGHHVHLEVQLCQHGGAGVHRGPKCGPKFGIWPQVLIILSVYGDTMCKHGGAGVHRGPKFDVCPKASEGILMLFCSLFFPSFDHLVPTQPPTIDKKWENIFEI